jgi:hypothetical protein
MLLEFKLRKSTGNEKNSGECFLVNIISGIMPLNFQQLWRADTQNWRQCVCFVSGDGAPRLVQGSDPNPSSEFFFSVTHHTSY